MTLAGVAALTSVADNTAYSTAVVAHSLVQAFEHRHTVVAVEHSMHTVKVDMLVAELVDVASTETTQAAHKEEEQLSVVVELVEVDIDTAVASKYTFAFDWADKINCDGDKLPGKSYKVGRELVQLGR